MQYSHGSFGPEPGVHFGSRLPCAPSETAIYDVLPDLMLRGVQNLEHFAGAFLGDQWLCNADVRQAVFCRAEAIDGRRRFTAYFIDQGHAFDGCAWALRESPLRGIYHRRVVYAGVRNWNSFDPWIERLQSIPHAEFDRILEEVPVSWIDDSSALTRLMCLLEARRRNARRFLEAAIRENPNAFVNWRDT